MCADPRRLVGVLALLLAQAGCSADPSSITRLHVSSSFNLALHINQLRFEVFDGQTPLFTPTLLPEPAAGPLPSGASVTILLPDRLAGQVLLVHVDGYFNLSQGAAGQTPVGSGEAMATPSVHAAVEVPITVAVPVAPSSLHVVPSSLALPAGTKMALVVNADYGKDGMKDVTADVEWASSDPSVATVTSGVGVLAMKPGSATLTASLAGVMGTAALTVTNATLTSLEVSAAGDTLHLAQMQQYSARGHYSDGGTVDLTQQSTWTSGTPTVASVGDSTGNKGLATAITPGKTQIGAAFNHLMAAATLTVN